MNLISAFYYYLECSIIHVQQRVWGRFYNESSALKVVNATMGVLWLITIVVINKGFKLSVDYALLFSIIPVIPWLWYHFSKTYRNKHMEDKRQDFERLPSMIRWIYIAYSALMTIVAPMAILGLIVWSFFR